MEELERIVHDEAQDPATTTRRLMLGLDDVSQMVRLPKLVSKLAKRMPLAHLEVVSIDTLIASGGLESGAADVAIAPKEAVGRFRSTALYEEEGVLVVSKGHPLLKKRFSAKAFAELRHIDIHVALGGAGAGHSVADDHFHRAGVRHRGDGSDVRRSCHDRGRDGSRRLGASRGAPEGKLADSARRAQVE